MKKLVTTAAASLMLIGGGLLAAAPASAYPLGADPAVAIVGANRLAPGDLSAVRAFNYKPRCTATVTFTRVGSTKVLAKRTRTVTANGTTTFAFEAPSGAGRFVAKVKQTKTADCAGFSATTRFRVVS